MESVLNLCWCYVDIEPGVWYSEDDEQYEGHSEDDEG